MAALVAPPSLGRKRPRKQTARQGRIAAMHNLVAASFVRKQFFATHHFRIVSVAFPSHGSAVERFG
jgi:hypothetical protein